MEVVELNQSTGCMSTAVVGTRSHTPSPPYDGRDLWARWPRIERLPRCTRRPHGAASASIKRVYNCYCIRWQPTKGPSLLSVLHLALNPRATPRATTCCALIGARRRLFSRVCLRPVLCIASAALLCSPVLVHKSSNTYPKRASLGRVDKLRS